MQVIRTKTPLCSLTTIVSAPLLQTTQGLAQSISGTELWLMDLNLYGRVLRRHWRLVVPGVLLAVALASLSMVRVSFDGIAYRQPEVWQSKSLLLLTQPGFPWGRVLPSTAAGPAAVGAGRLQSLTELYAQLANSDEVKRMMVKDGAPKTWKIVADPIQQRDSGSVLPVVALSGQAFSAKDAVAAAAYGRRAFIRYLSSQQEEAAIPAAQRVQIQLLNASSTPRPVVIKAHSKTLPLMVLLAVLSATLGLAFILENRSPYIRAVATPDEDEVLHPADVDVRRWG